MIDIKRTQISPRSEITSLGPLTLLAQQVLTGDRDAERRFVELALSRLLALLRARGTTADAEDFALDAIAEAMVRLGRLTEGQTTGDPVFAYMAVTALNRMRRAYREQARELRALKLLAESELLPEVQASDRLQERPLWRSQLLTDSRSEVVFAAETLMSTLSEPDKMLVKLRAQTNLTWTDIGREVGKSATVVRQRWHRIRKRVLARMPATAEG